MLIAQTALPTSLDSGISDRPVTSNKRASWAVESQRHRNSSTRQFGPDTAVDQTGWLPSAASGIRGSLSSATTTEYGGRSSTVSSLSPEEPESLPSPCAAALCPETGFLATVISLVYALSLTEYSHMHKCTDSFFILFPNINWGDVKSLARDYSGWLKKLDKEFHSFFPPAGYKLGHDSSEWLSKWLEKLDKEKLRFFLPFAEDELAKLLEMIASDMLRHMLKYVISFRSPEQCVQKACKTSMSVKAPINRCAYFNSLVRNGMEHLEELMEERKHLTMGLIYVLSYAYTCSTDRVAPSENVETQFRRRSREFAQRLSESETVQDMFERLSVSLGVLKTHNDMTDSAAQHCDDPLPDKLVVLLQKHYSDYVQLPQADDSLSPLECIPKVVVMSRVLEPRPISGVLGEQHCYSVPIDTWHLRRLNFIYTHWFRYIRDEVLHDALENPRPVSFPQARANIKAAKPKPCSVCKKEKERGEFYEDTSKGIDPDTGLIRTSSACKMCMFERRNNNKRARKIAQATLSV